MLIFHFDDGVGFDKNVFELFRAWNDIGIFKQIFCDILTNNGNASTFKDLVLNQWEVIDRNMMLGWQLVNLDKFF